MSTQQDPASPPPRRCRGCGQAFPGSRDTMAVNGKIEHISCYDPAWDVADVVLSEPEEGPEKSMLTIMVLYDEAYKLITVEASSGTPAQLAAILQAAATQTAERVELATLEGLRVEYGEGTPEFVARLTELRRRYPQ